MLRRKSVSIVIFLLLIYFFNHSTWAADWGFRGLLPRGTGYYDKSSIKKVNQNISRVWTVTIYNEKGKESALSILKKQNKEPVNPKILNQESTLLEFDCLHSKFRIVAFNIYDEDDNLLFSIPEIHAEWNDIKRGSVNEKLETIICRSDEHAKKDSK